MAKTIKSNWVTNFWEDSNCFLPIRALSSELETFAVWPDLAEYQQLLNTETGTIRTASDHKLQIVPQDAKSESFNQNYAPRIYLTGEVQTRTENWHDFFQVMTWRLFPLSKAVINTRQYHAANERHLQQQHTGRRSKVENILSRFDECGAIVIYSDPELARMMLDHEWTDLFWNNREAFEKEISCFIFGHALYEKFFNPYIGMTANCIMLEQKPDFLSLPLNEQLSLIDNDIASMLTGDTFYEGPNGLRPLPVLGIPGWYPENESETFYNDTTYFRPRS